MMRAQAENIIPLQNPTVDCLLPFQFPGLTSTSRVLSDSWSSGKLDTSFSAVKQDWPFLIITPVVLREPTLIFSYLGTNNWGRCFYIVVFSKKCLTTKNYYKWLVNRSTSGGFSPACLASLLQILVGPFFLDEICQMQVKLVLPLSEHSVVQL